MGGGWFQWQVRVARVAACAALLAGCTEVIHNQPVNQPLASDVKQAEIELGSNLPPNYDDTVIALSFSGGCLLQARA